MCGIFFKCTKNLNNSINYRILKENDNKVYQFLKNRGPDRQDVIIINDDNSNVPPNKESKNIEMCGFVLWMQGDTISNQPLSSENGCFLFNGDLFNTDWIKGTSDTEALYSKLNQQSDECNSKTQNNIISIIKSLNGPFALIYLDKINNKVYFCRDRIGRRSLLVYKNDTEFILSSTLSRKYKNAVELPSKNIYCLCLLNNSISEFSWTSGESHPILYDMWYQSLLENNSENSNITSNIILDEDSILIDRLNEISLKFSSPSELFENLLQEKSILKIVDSLTEYLSESVKTRVRTQPDMCRNCVNSKVPCNEHCTVGILFSGGLDCTILAAIAHSHIPIDQSIDLLNVAFTKTQNFNTPDRLTSKKSYEELCDLFPQRKWNLLEINVTFDELEKKQQEEIADLIYPLQTILDESLGSALWFAANGKTSEYTSTCRIVLTGIGADELFGGYTRHRNAYKRGGWNRLHNELIMDWQRIASRNLARDDRVISHHGRQPRMPYLDEKFVEYVLSLNPWERCFPSEKCGPGLGDKMFLRLVAFKIGLINTSTFPKRAIQFGSKIANKKENAKDISQRLLCVEPFSK